MHELADFAFRSLEITPSEGSLKRDQASAPQAWDHPTDFPSIFEEGGSNILYEGEPALHIVSITKRESPGRCGDACLRSPSGPTPQNKKLPPRINPSERTARDVQAS